MTGMAAGGDEAGPCEPGPPLEIEKLVRNNKQGRKLDAAILSHRKQGARLHLNPQNALAAVGLFFPFFFMMLALATGLVPKIGYDKAAAVSKKAYETGRSILEILLKEKILSEKEFNDWLKGQFK